MKKNYNWYSNWNGYMYNRYNNLYKIFYVRSR